MANNSSNINNNLKNSVVDIAQSVDDQDLVNLRSVGERYYEYKYCMKVDTIEDDIHQRLCFHSNRIVMLSLADNHPVMRDRKEIRCVQWQIDCETDRRKSEAIGKGKKGAHKLRADSVICRVECVDGSSYPVYACFTGSKLLEVNSEQLEVEPSLLLNRPLSNGYIALIQPHLHLYTEFKESLLTQQQYVDICNVQNT